MQFLDCLDFPFSLYHSFPGYDGNVSYGLCSFEHRINQPVSRLFVDGVLVGEAVAIPLDTKCYPANHIPFSFKFNYPLEDIWIPDFIYIDDSQRNKGYGKALLLALAEAIRLKNPNAVLSPADIGYRYHQDYEPGRFGTSLDALRSWNSIGRLYI
jgi:GNAT superfamily N-acetyltransferase